MSEKISLFLFCIVLFAAVDPLHGEGTFVGNGGSADDLDIKVAIAEINTTFTKMTSSDLDLCRCDDALASSPMCLRLRALNEPQRQLCIKTLLQNREAMMLMTAPDANVRVQWSNEDLNVFYEDGSTRPVDGIAERRQRLITLNHDKFKSMSRLQRMALLTHELFHLIPVDGKYIDDEPEVGPFATGRDYLDALGVAVAKTAFDLDVPDEFRDISRVSRADRLFWLGTSFGGMRAFGGQAEDRLLDGAYSTAELEATLGFGPLKIGFMADYDRASATKAFRIEEYREIYSAVLGYSFRPVGSFLSRWNELQMVTFVGYGGGRGSLKFYDGNVTLSDTSRLKSAKCGLVAKIPMVHGFWFDPSVELRHVAGEYNSFDLNINETAYVYKIGGSYGF
jgi:hypothetical protein